MVFTVSSYISLNDRVKSIQEKSLSLLVLITEVHSSLFGGAGTLVSIKVFNIYPWLGLPQDKPNGFGF